MDFLPNSYFNNFYREELIFRVWNIKVLGTYLTEKSYYETPICAPLKNDPWEAMSFSIQTSVSNDEGLGQIVKNEVMDR